MKILPLILLLNFIFLSCNKNRLGGCASCISQRIEKIKKEPRWNPAAEIHEYLYNGQVVYLISADCCDQFMTLVDKNCKYICAPSGGITGKGDGKCADFYEKAQHVRLVWKDPR